MQWVAGFDFTVEFQYGALVKDVLHIPLRFHGEVVAAVGAHSCEFGEEIGSPQIRAAVDFGVGAGNRFVYLVARREIVPLVVFVLVAPLGKGHEISGLLLGRIRMDLVERRGEPAFEGFNTGTEFLRESLNAALMLAVEIVLEIDPGRGHEIPDAVCYFFEQGTSVQSCLTGHLEELVLSFPEQPVLVAGRKVPAHEHVVEVGLRFVTPGDGHTLERHGPGGNDSLIRGAQHFLAKLAEEVEVIGSGAKRGFFDNFIDVPHGEVVLSRDFEVGRAFFDEFHRGALAAFAVTLNGCSAFRGND